MTRIRLTDIYDARELDDEQEAICHHAPEDPNEVAYEVIEIGIEAAVSLRTMFGDMTVMESFRSHACEGSRQLVEEKMREFDESRIIVLQGESVIDGHHHVAAAVKAGRGLRAIDLARPLPHVDHAAQTPSFG